MARIQFQGDGPVTGSDSLFVQSLLDVQGILTNTSGTLTLSGAINIDGSLEISGAGAPITEVTGADNFHVKQVLYASGSIINPDGHLILSSSDGAVAISGNLKIPNDTLLRFGDEDSGYAGLKGQNTLVLARLADDSTYADFYANTIVANNRIRVPGSGYYYWSERSIIHSTDNGQISLSNYASEQLLLLGGDASGSIIAPNTHLILSSSAGSQITVSGALTVESDVVAQSLTSITSVTIGSIYGCGWAGKSIMGSTADGYIELYNNAGNDFSLLRFGGTTSAYPSIKRDSATLQARLADDSDFTDLTVKNLSITGDLSVAGSTTVISSSNLLVEDPLIMLALSQSGVPSPTFDAGFIVERGSVELNAGFIWDESADAFACITTPETGTTAGDVSISSYANLYCSTIYPGSVVGSGYLQAAADSYIFWNGRSILSSPVDGNILLIDNAGTDFGLLQFGTTGSDAPALKRSGTELHAKLADDSNFANFIAYHIIAAGYLRVASTQDIYWTNRTRLSAPSDGAISIENYSNEEMLRFGGDLTGSIVSPNSELILSSSVDNSYVTVSGNFKVQGATVVRNAAGSSVYSTQDNSTTFWKEIIARDVIYNSADHLILSSSVGSQVTVSGNLVSMQNIYASYGTMQASVIVPVNALSAQGGSDSKINVSSLGGAETFKGINATGDHLILTSSAGSYITVSGTLKLDDGGSLPKIDLKYGSYIDRSTLYMNSGVGVTLKNASATAGVTVETTSNNDINLDVGTGTVNVSGNLKVLGEIFAAGTEETLVGITGVVVDTLDSAVSRTAKYIVSISSGSKFFQAEEILLIHSASESNITEYAVVTVGTEDPFVGFEASVTGSDVNLIASSSYEDTNVRIVRTSIDL